MTHLIIKLMFYISMLFNPNSTLESDTVEDAKSDKVEQSYQKTDKGWGKEQHQ